MNDLMKFQRSLMDSICECLIIEGALRKDLSSTADIKVSSGDLQRIREETLSRFRQKATDEMNELFRGENMPDLFEKLKEMESSSKGKIGWRPLGDAQRDSYGARRGHLLECKMRLEALKEDLERKIKESSSGPSN